jgi:hypothetical protein
MPPPLGFERDAGPFQASDHHRRRLEFTPRNMAEDGLEQTPGRLAISRGHGSDGSARSRRTLRIQRGAPQRAISCLREQRAMRGRATMQAG